MELLFQHFLGEGNNVEKYVGNTDSSEPQSITKGYVGFYYNDAPLNDGRPIVFNTPINLAVADPLLNGEMTFIVSNYQLQLDNALSNFQNLQLPAGTGSITYIGTTWTGSGADYGTFTPAVIGFSAESVDSTGELVDNRSTLENQPEFSLFLNNISGDEALPTTQLLSGSYFTSSLNTSTGVLSTPDRSAIGFAYDIQTTVPFSGSDSGNGLGNMFSASITQFPNIFHLPQPYQMKLIFIILPSIH